MSSSTVNEQFMETLSSTSNAGSTDPRSKQDKHIMILLILTILFVCLLTVLLLVAQQITYEGSNVAKEKITLYNILKIFVSAVFVIVMIEIMYVFYISQIFKKDVLISCLENRSFILTTYFSTTYEMCLRATQRHDRQPIQISTSKAFTKDVLHSMFIYNIASILKKGKVPSGLDIDLSFKPIAKSLKEQVSDPEMLDKNSEQINEIEDESIKDIEAIFKKEDLEESNEEDKEISVGPVEILDSFLKNSRKSNLLNIKEHLKFIDQMIDLYFSKSFDVVSEREKTVKDKDGNITTVIESHKVGELVGYLNILDSELYIDKALSLVSESESKKEREYRYELDKMFGTIRPKVFIVFRPKGVSNIDRPVKVFNEQLNTHIKEYAVKMNLFYFGSVAGIPIFVDILNIIQMQRYEDFRISEGKFRSLKLDSLMFILVLLAQRWETRDQLDLRREMMEKVMRTREDVMLRDFEEFLRNASDHINDIKSKSENLVKKEFLPRVIDHSHKTSYFCGFMSAAVLILSFLLAYQNLRGG